jgi:hypothetical protein
VDKKKPHLFGAVFSAYMELFLFSLVWKNKDRIKSALVFILDEILI